MPRLRLGVVLLVPAPVDAEVDALRKALGDGTLGRVPAHLTLVPPVNVREDRAHDARQVLRDAAAESRAFTVTLGAPVSFLPDSPTLFLPVVEGAEAVHQLRDRVFRDPLARPLTWQYVPHVTVADEVDPARIAAAQTALAPYEAVVNFDRVHLLQEGPGRVWTPYAEAAMAAPAVIGRGGLPLELSVTAMLDPEADALLGERLCITARRDGTVVGVARGWTAGDLAHLESIVVAPAERNQGIGSHLLAAFDSAAAERGCRREGDRLLGDLLRRL